MRRSVSWSLRSLLTRFIAIGTAFALLFTTAVQSATVYRSVDANGKVVYSDQPPQCGKVDKKLNLVSGPATPVPDAVLRHRAELEKSANKRLADLAKPPAGVSLLFTTKTCVYCKHAKAYLAAKGLPYQEHDIETPEGMKVFASTGGKGSGVPVLVQNDKRVMGFSKELYDGFFQR